MADVARAAGLPQLRLNTTYTRAFKNARAIHEVAAWAPPDRILVEHPHHGADVAYHRDPSFVDVTKQRRCRHGVSF